MNTLKVVKYFSLITLLSIFAILLFPKNASSEFDVQSLNDQVQNHEQRLDNLESKTDQLDTQIRQNTADIYVIQQQTGTPPANPVEPTQPSVNSEPTPDVTTEPEPVIVTSVHGSYAVKQSSEPLQYNWYCDYTYSDDTSDTHLVGQSNTIYAQPMCDKRVGSKK